MKPIVDVSGVSRIYGSGRENRYHALSNVSFLMQEGEFVGIMGPSGSGKTTLLNVISTLDKASSGTVKIAGEDITGMKTSALSDFRSKRLGFIFQDFNLLDNLTVYENIALPLSLQNLPPGMIRQQVGEVMDNLGITDIGRKYPAEISGGQKQRAAAARAIVHEPALILGDEPTGSLDSRNAFGLLELLKELNEQRRLSILMVTHDAVSASYCGRILFIQDGRIVKELLRSGSREMFYSRILSELGEFGTIARGAE